MDCNRSRSERSAECGVGCRQVELGYRPNDRSAASILDTSQHLNGAFKESRRDAPAHSTISSKAKDRRQQDSETDGPSNRNRTETAEQVKGKDALVAFDDKELSAWVMRLGEERSGRFLCALAGGRDEGGCGRLFRYPAGTARPEAQASPWRGESREN